MVEVGFGGGLARRGGSAGPWQTPPLGTQPRSPRAGFHGGALAVEGGPMQQGLLGRGRGAGHHEGLAQGGEASSSGLSGAASRGALDLEARLGEGVERAEDLVERTRMLQEHFEEAHASMASINELCEEADAFILRSQINQNRSAKRLHDLTMRASSRSLGQDADHVVDEFGGARTRRRRTSWHHAHHAVDELSELDAEPARRRRGSPCSLGHDGGRAVGELSEIVEAPRRRESSPSPRPDAYRAVDETGEPPPRQRRRAPPRRRSRERRLV